MARMRHRRAGFTTIELFVVIAIIAVLLALLVGGVMALYRNRVQPQQTSSDITSLISGLEGFKGKYGVYPPSSLNKNNYKKRLQMIWPSINADAALASLGLSPSSVDLQGDQCLVLFLGGRHQMANGVATEPTSGFSENPINPFISQSDPTEQVGKRVAPFMTFNMNRLYQRTPGVPVASYGDGWFRTTVSGVERFPCYAYFSTTDVTASNSSNGVGYYSDSDCSRMTDFTGSGYPLPYVDLNFKQPSGKYQYVNPRSYQIISAGNDLLFGTAYKFPAVLAPASADTTYIGGDAGGSPVSRDNFTNFFQGRLGDS